MNHEITFSIGEVASMLGMTATTLRAWERRYRIVAPGRSPNSRRRYTLEQVERLRLMKTIARAGSRSLRLAALESQGLIAQAHETLAGDGHSEAPQGDALWRTAADLSDTIQLFVGRDGRIIDANVALARAYSLLKQQVRGRRFADLVDAYDREKAVVLYRGPAVRRRGWELNLRTIPPTLQSFESWPLVVDGKRLVFLRGTDITGTGVE